LGALNRQHEFRLHLKGALTNGCTLEEIRDTLLQLAVYCGVPAGVEAFRIAAEVFREENIDTKELLRAPGD
jgi:4-carboxymuconolactone decarboxylase